MFRVRELRYLLVEPRFQLFGNQEFAVDEEEFRHYAFETLPYELDGSEVRATGLISSSSAISHTILA